MLRHVTLTVVLLAAVPAAADVVPISVTQQVSGSGSVLLCVPLSFGCDAEESGGFSFPPGSSGSASVASPDGRYMSVYASAQQTSDVSSTSVKVALDSFGLITGLVTD